MEWFRSRVMRTTCWLAMLVIAGQLFMSPALTQEAGTPIAPVDEAVEAMAVDPTESPAELPDELTSTPTLPDETEESPEPTAEPEPTATPAPALAFTLAPGPTCLVADDQPSELASGGTIEYRCISRIALTGESIAPAGIAIDWEIEAMVTEGWIVQLQPPARTPGETPVWTDFTNGKTHFSVKQEDVAGSSMAPGSISSYSEIVYRLRIIRPACLAGAPIIELRHGAQVRSPEVTAIDLSAGVDPARIVPTLAAIPSPDISFDGPLNFGTIQATALGLSETRIDGSLRLTVSGLDRACGEWNLWLHSTPIVDADGLVREGFSLLIEECDLTGGCLAATFVTGPDAPATQSITLTITLQTPQYAALGALGTTIDATAIASAHGT